MTTPADGLSEFISRKGRTRIVKLISSNGWPIQKLAEELGVSRQTIHQWLAPSKTHPCNSNLTRLLDLAIDIDRARTAEILWEEATLFYSLLAQRPGTV